MLKRTIIIAAALSTLTAGAALAGPAERAERFDNRLTRAEINGQWAQGSRADHWEDRFDIYEDRLDRREDYRDRQVDWGRRDVIEDYWDRAENRRDRAENVIDRRAD